LKPNHTGGLIALGVALARQNKSVEAIDVLRRASAIEPDNSDALRNLAACLLGSGKAVEAEEISRRVVAMSPSDQQAWFGHAEAVFAQDGPQDADELYRKAIDIDASSEIAELARGRLSEIAQKIFRSKTPGAERMDAVMYLVGAIEKFGRMSKQGRLMSCGPVSFPEN
jgi:tetratricopeptide (TPR) repeat protein